MERSLLSRVVGWKKREKSEELKVCDLQGKQQDGLITVG
jgi:hypothetical protein